MGKSKIADYCLDEAAEQMQKTSMKGAARSALVASLCKLQQMLYKT